MNGHGCNSGNTHKRTAVIFFSTAESVSRMHFNPVCISDGCSRRLPKQGSPSDSARQSARIRENGSEPARQNPKATPDRSDLERGARGPVSTAPATLSRQGLSRRILSERSLSGEGFSQRTGHGVGADCRGAPRPQSSLENSSPEPHPRALRRHGPRTHLRGRAHLRLRRQSSSSYRSSCRPPPGQISPSPLRTDRTGIMCRDPVRITTTKTTRHDTGGTRDSGNESEKFSRPFFSAGFRQPTIVTPHS